MIILSDFLDVLNPSHVLKIKLGEENEGELNDKIDISKFFFNPFHSIHFPKLSNLEK